MTGADAELDRQVATLAQRLGLDHEALAETAAPLREAARAAEGEIPFAVVLSPATVPAETALGAVEREGHAAVTMFAPGELERFTPIEPEAVPAGAVHLVSGIEPIGDTRNLTPDAALDRLRAAGRSPLTIEEGIALAIHHPASVAPNAGFSLPGSRCGDRRVAALWISERRPKLGWCWAGNPHTWLGSASCAARAGVPLAG